jgi:uncharacterized membrane protein YdjX (TVP38/TMEM64 family)
MQKKYRALGASVLLFIGLFFVLRQSGLVHMFQGEQLKTTVLGFGIWAPLIYMSFYALASLLFIPGSPLTLVGGALFGPWYGTLYTVVGATAGALLAFVGSRAVGQGFYSQGTGKISQRLAVYDEKIAANGFLAVLFLRFVPLFPFNGLNFALGLTKVSFRDYFFGTLLGIIPGTFVFVYFGDSLSKLSPIKIGSAVFFLVALSLVGKYVMKRYDTKK